MTIHLPDDDDMHFGGESFTTPDLNVPDDMLGIDDEDLGQIDIDPRQLGLQPSQDATPQIIAPGQTDDEVAEGVEDQLLELLQNGGREEILMVSGDRPTVASQTSDDLRGFQMAYARAVRVNPAIRWYARFASLLPEGKFGISNGSLQIHMPPAMFRKAVAPFLGDFREAFADTSPMTSAVLNLAGAARQAHAAAVNRTIQGGMRSQSNVEPMDFNPGLSDFSGNQIDDAIGASTPDGEMRPPMDPMPVAPRLPISLTDLSLKAVADHIAGLEGDDDALMGHLLDAGFAKSKANEILAMARYRRLLNARRQGRYAPVGNIGGGDVEFSFR